MTARTGGLILGLVVTLAAAVFIYRPSWNNPFVLDDMIKIQQNPDVRLEHPGLNAFFAPYDPLRSNLRNDPSRPFTFFIYNLCWRAGSGSPVPFHIVSTVVHGLSAFLLGLLAVGLMTRFGLAGGLFGGWIATVLFLITPLLAGSVYYAYALSDLLATLFILAALVLGPRIWAMAGFFVLALASKQSAAAFPIAVLALDLMVGGFAEIRRRWCTHATLILIALFYFALRFWYLGGIGDLEAQGTPGAVEYALSQGLMIFKYLWMLFVPIGLTIDHFIRPEHLNLELEILAWLAVFGFTGSAIYLGATGKGSPLARLVALGGLVFLIFLLPVSSVLPTVDLFVERRAYLAAIGPIFSLAVLLAWIEVAPAAAGKRKLAWGICLGVQLYYMDVTRDQADVYSSKESLWAQSLQQYPLSPRAHLNLATAEAAAGDYSKARQLLEELRTMQPDNGVIYSKLGFIYAQADNKDRDDQKAWDYYKKSFELLPDDVIALLNGGALLMHLGKFPEASQLLLHAVELSPGMAYAHLLAGQALVHAGKKAESIPHFQKVLELEPDNGEAAKYLQAVSKSP